MNLDDLNALDIRIFSGVQLFGADLHLFVVTLIYILWSMRRDPYGWRKRDSARAAVGLFVYCLGMFLVRGWGVPLLIMIKHGIPTVQMENAYPISLVGTIIAMWGIFCMVRVFTPEGWRWYGWAAPMILWIVLGAVATQL